MDATAVQPIRPEDLQDPKEYEGVRKQRLVEMVRYKNARRLALADDVTILFEDRKTVQHQIQEMVRLEGDDADAVEGVFRHYADLMPNGNDLIATLFVEVKDPKDIKPRLRHYARLAEAIRLEVGDAKVQPRLLGESGDDEAATAVTYMRFPVPREHRQGLDGAALVVDHPQLQGRFPLPDAARTVPT